MEYLDPLKVVSVDLTIVTISSALVSTPQRILLSVAAGAQILKAYAPIL
jgi:hypothetical protein